MIEETYATAKSIKDKIRLKQEALTFWRDRMNDPIHLAAHLCRGTNWYYEEICEPGMKSERSPTNDEFNSFRNQIIQRLEKEIAELNLQFSNL